MSFYYIVLLSCGGIMHTKTDLSEQILGKRRQRNEQFEKELNACAIVHRTFCMCL